MSTSKALNICGRRPRSGATAGVVKRGVVANYLLRGLSCAGADTPCAKLLFDTLPMQVLMPRRMQPGVGDEGEKPC